MFGHQLDTTLDLASSMNKSHSWFSILNTKIQKELNFTLDYKEMRITKFYFVMIVALTGAGQKL